jgi:tetratricopeptide (TPR) repeat protein
VLDGTVIAGRFVIERLVAEGGMGAVYRARDRSTGEPVALKLLLAPVGHRDQDERFAREIRLLADIDHPRVARYVAHGAHSDGRAYLAMQWLDGCDLHAALASGPLSLADSLRVLMGAAEAVAAVHARGIVHRDLKPRNLFLRGGSTDDVVLIDFGVSRRLDASTFLTGTTIVGTPHYMAPEQVSSSREILPAADIFSLGCVFYECLTGKRPFDAGQIYGVLARILYDTPEPARALDPSIPESWSSLISLMLAKPPSARPAHGAALLRELAQLSPARSEEGIAPKRAATTNRDPESSDQVLVCVVLATVPGAMPGPGFTPDRFESIQSAMHRFGCPIERLTDGSLLATVFPRSSATDLVHVGARCAMYLREQMPDALIAVATGRAPLGPSPRIGHAVDRAAALLGGVVSPEGIQLDTLTRELLDARFVTATRDGVNLLIGEKPDLDDSRPLLGKPTPCVGRELELIQLEGVMSSAVEESLPKAAVVIGPPGIGKSRLRHELLRRLRHQHPTAAVLVGYGDPLSAGSPYVLLSDALRRHAGIQVADGSTKARGLVVEQLCHNVELAHKRRVAEFLGELAGVPFAAEESPPLAAARGDHRVMSEQITLAFSDWLTAECAAHPVVMVLEDLQWGDALTVRLLDTALRDLRQGALFVLALGRPELEEIFPTLLNERRALSLSLRALSVKACELLVKGVLGEHVAGESLSRIVRLAAGNALFLEELIRAAAEGKAGDVPETVLAMLQARLSRLPPGARLLLRAASIQGEVFWRGGLGQVCQAWGTQDDPDPLLAQLVDSELIARARISRFPGDIQYTFRHALVCEAAGGLLTAGDRRSGHLAACRWLEAAGEIDGIVLARHAEDGGDRAQAISYTARAAEQSIGQHDFAQALARATKGISLGAEGQTLGVLRSVEASALFSMGRWTQAAQAGLSALELVSRGGVLWFSVVETLMQVLPNVGEFQRCEDLSDEVLRIVPPPEAQTAYLRAVALQLLGCAISGARQRGQACLRFMDGMAVAESDIVARGYSRLYRAVFTCILGSDLSAALALAEQAAHDLAESQVMYRLSLAHTVQSFVWWGLGDHDKSERAARRGQTIAREIHDDYHAALADWYLGLALCEQADSAKLAEAEECAETMVLLEKSAIFVATSRILIARVALERNDWTRAEAEGRASRAGLVGVTPYWLMASAHLLTALVRQGRGHEAGIIARDDLLAYERTGGPICSEILFKIAIAEALFEDGDRKGAESMLRDALWQIGVRAEQIADRPRRQTYLTGRPENRRALVLAETWGLDDVLSDPLHPGQTSRL